MRSLRTQGIGLSVIKEMELRGSKIPGVVSLAQGIPSFETDPRIKSEVLQYLQRPDIGKYSLSPGLLELREMIEDALRKDGIHYDYEHEIIVTVGSIEGLSATLLTLLEEEDEVLIPNPSYATYAEAVRVAHGTPVFIDLSRENHWSLPVQEIQKKTTNKTRAMIICQPNNPTGAIYQEEDLRALAAWAKERDIYVIFDEVYKDFAYTDKAPFRLETDPRYRSHIICLYSFSKAYAMTGWRVGFLLAQRDLAKEILKSHDTLVTCAPMISQYAAMAALRFSESIISNYRNEYLSRRDLTLRLFAPLASILSASMPSAGYFFFPKILVPHKTSHQFAVELLEKAKVNTVPGSAFGPAGEGFLRVCFGRSEEDLQEAFARLYHYFSV